jgi:hypothetical protein
LIDQVKAIVRTHRFLDVTEVAKLSGVAAEVILVHAGKIPEVQKIAHPNMTLLVWRG